MMFLTLRYLLTLDDVFQLIDAGQINIENNLYYSFSDALAFYNKLINLSPILVKIRKINYNNTIFLCDNKELLSFFRYHKNIVYNYERNKILDCFLYLIDSEI
jgi:hypothetical protein